LEKIEIRKYLKAGAAGVRTGAATEKLKILKFGKILKFEI